MKREKREMILNAIRDFKLHGDGKEGQKRAIKDIIRLNDKPEIWMEE